MQSSLRSSVLKGRVLSRWQRQGMLWMASLWKSWLATSWKIDGKG